MLNQFRNRISSVTIFSHERTREKDFVKIIIANCVNDLFAIKFGRNCLIIEKNFGCIKHLKTLLIHAYESALNIYIYNKVLHIP